MIAAALLLQVAAAPLVVRAAAGADTLPVRITGGTAMVDPSAFGRIGAMVRAVAEGRYRLTIGGTSFDLVPGVPFVTVRDSIHVPLVAAPVADTSAATIRVPLQLVSEVVPRFATNLIYDPARRELRLFEPTVFGGVRPPVSTVTPAAGPAAPARSPTRSAPGTGASRSRARRLVVVDPGHGGPDHGMSGPVVGGARFHEKHIVLDASKRLRESLVARGMDVVLTRSTDTLIALADRGRIANERGGDLFVSVHVNAANPQWRDPAAARGVETYFLAEAKTEDAKRVEQMENEAIRFETGVSAARDDPLNFIINDMAQNEHLRESSALADGVQRRLAAIHPGVNRGVKQAGFRVLVSAFMPAILIELGFGTNRDEAAWMASAGGQRQLASAIADAIVEYLDAYERRVSPSP